MKLCWTDFSRRKWVKQKGEFHMGSNQKANPVTDIRKTRFTVLKDQQCALNMQIRLAMQLHDRKAQADLEKKLREVTEQIEQISC